MPPADTGAWGFLSANAARMSRSPLSILLPLAISLQKGHTGRYESPAPHPERPGVEKSLRDGQRLSALAEDHGLARGAPLHVHWDCKYHAAIVLKNRKRKGELD